MSQRSLLIYLWYETVPSWHWMEVRPEADLTNGVAITTKSSVRPEVY